MRGLAAAAVLLFILLALTATAPLCAQERVRAGNYEIVMTKAGQTSSTTHCFTPAEVKVTNGDAGLMKAMTQSTAAASHFTVTDFKMEDNTVSFTMVGSGLSLATVTTYYGDSYETTMTSTSAQGVSRNSCAFSHQV